VFRALNHEGVAADCLYALIVGDQKLTGERKLMAFTACAVIAKSLAVMRRG
jgi:hypothetical protein